MEDGVHVPASSASGAFGALTDRKSVRVTRLGLLLRALRRRLREPLPRMAERLGAQSLGLSPETLAAFERGDAAPPPGFLQRLERVYALSETERSAFEQAVFLAADPFLLEGAETLDDANSDEALTMLRAPIQEGFDDAAAGNAALLTLRAPSPSVRRSGSANALETLRQTAKRLRRAVAREDGRVPAEALIDGIETLCPAPIRVVFADGALSAAAFGGASPADLAFSGVSALGDASDAGAAAAERRETARRSVGAVDSGHAAGPQRGGYVCLRAGLLQRIVDDDPAARFALLHEIGHRLAGHGDTPFFSERMVKTVSTLVTPRFRHRKLDADRLRAAVGAAHPAAASAEGERLTAALSQEAAANLFAFCTLTETEEFSPAVDRLDHWCARYGAPLAAALAFQRRAPELFEGAPIAAPSVFEVFKRQRRAARAD